MRMKFVWGLLIAFLSIAFPAQAQVIVGPASTFQWDVVNYSVSLQYNLTVDSASPIVLNTITCAASTPPVANQQTCKIPLVPQVPIGTHTLTMTAQQGTLVSAVSSAYAYTTLVIPIPSNLKIVKTWYGTIRYEWRA